MPHTECAWCSQPKNSYYYPFIVRMSAGHTICWIRQAKATMAKLDTYAGAINNMVWLYTHVINITRAHHGVGSMGTGFIILEVMGIPVYTIWMELIKEFGIPRGESSCDHPALKHKIESYTKWLFANRGYSTLVDYHRIVLSEKWNDCLN